MALYFLHFHNNHIKSIVKWEVFMNDRMVEKVFGIVFIILSVFLFFTKRGGMGFLVFLIGLGLYIFSRRGTDYRSM